MVGNEVSFQPLKANEKKTQIINIDIKYKSKEEGER